MATKREQQEQTYWKARKATAYELYLMFEEERECAYRDQLTELTFDIEKRGMLRGYAC